MAAMHDLATPERMLMERRRHRRVPVALPVRWSAPGVADDSWLPAVSVDASAGGMLLRTALPAGVRAGTPVCVAVDLPGRQVVALAECCDVRSVDAETGEALLAVQFTAMGRPDLRALVRLLVDRELATP